MGIDDQVGRIIEELRHTNLLENTIVIITEDHGNSLGNHGQHTKNNIYEESLRIPFLIYWKGKIQPGVDNFLNRLEYRRLLSVGYSGLITVSDHYS